MSSFVFTEVAEQLAQSQTEADLGNAPVPTQRRSSSVFLSLPSFPSSQPAAEQTATKEVEEPPKPGQGLFAVFVSDCLLFDLLN